MVVLALNTGLGVELCMFHGLSQDRSIDAGFGVTVPDTLGPGMAGVSAALVQGFLLFRAARVRSSNVTVRSGA